MSNSEEKLNKILKSADDSFFKICPKGDEISQLYNKIEFLKIHLKSAFETIEWKNKILDVDL